MGLKRNICTLSCSRGAVPRSTWAGPTTGESTSVSQRVYKMRSFQENVSIFTRNTTNLVIQISELNQLREQLRKALQSAQIAAPAPAEENAN